MNVESETVTVEEAAASMSGLLEETPLIVDVVRVNVVLDPVIPNKAAVDVTVVVIVTVVNVAVPPERPQSECSSCDGGLKVTFVGDKMFEEEMSVADNDVIATVIPLNERVAVFVTEPPLTVSVPEETV